MTPFLEVNQNTSQKSEWQPRLVVQSPARSGSTVAAVILGTVVIAVLIGAVVLSLVVPPGTTLAGEHLSNPGEAARIIAETQQQLVQHPVHLSTPVGTETTVTGQDLGWVIDEIQTTAALNKGLPLLELWIDRIQGPIQLPIELRPTDPVILSELGVSLSRDPIEPTVSVAPRTIDVEEGEAGIVTDAGDVASGLNDTVDAFATTQFDRWPSPLSVTVDGETTQPRTTDADLETLTEAIETLEKQTVDVVASTPLPDGLSRQERRELDEDGDGYRTETLTLTSNEMRALFAVESVPDAPEGQRLQLVPDVETPPVRVQHLADQARRSPNVRGSVQNASPGPERGDNLEDVSTISGTPILEEVTGGFEPDLEATMAQVIDAAQNGGGVVRMASGEPGTFDLYELGIREPISTFTTFYTPGQSRNQNIQRIAEIVDGVVILPGDSYEVNHSVGRRTVENGFTTGGAILDGKVTSDIGGGVSQFATTFFNAAWFSGIELVDYKAHSIYFSRYPAGREATINYPNVNLEVHNDTPYAILVDTQSDESSVTVTFWSTPYWQVQTVTGPCRCSGAFSINVERIITGPDGERRTETHSTTYTVPLRDE